MHIHKFMCFSTKQIYEICKMHQQDLQDASVDGWLVTVIVFVAVVVVNIV